MEGRGEILQRCKRIRGPRSSISLYISAARFGGTNYYYYSYKMRFDGIEACPVGVGGDGNNNTPSTTPVIISCGGGRRQQQQQQLLLPVQRKRRRHRSKMTTTWLPSQAAPLFPPLLQCLLCLLFMGLVSKTEALISEELVVQTTKGLIRGVTLKSATNK